MDFLPSRLKAARALTPPTEQEIKRRSDRTQKWTGITTRELAGRIDRARFSYSRLRNVESGIGGFSDYELPVIAEAVGMPLEFFVLSRSELMERIAAEETPELRGDLARELQDGQPSPASQRPPKSRAKGAKKRATGG